MQGRGSKKTPERLVNLLKLAVSETSQSYVARETGLTQSAMHRYLKGIGEPSTETLQKLAYYFGVSLAWLRGGAEGPTERLLDGLKKAGVDSGVFNEKMFLYLLGFEDTWLALLRGELSPYMQNLACQEFGINESWVRTGDNTSIDFNKVEPLVSGFMKAVCSQCHGDVNVLLDRGKAGNTPLVITVDPCKTCCRGK